MASPDQELQRWFDGLAFKYKRELATMIKDEADGLAAEIKARAPRKSGVLAGTVKVRRRKNDLDLEITAGGDETRVEVRSGSGETIDRALFPEFGTVHQPANPFFYNTARERMPEIRQRIEDKVAELGGKV